MFSPFKLEKLKIKVYDTAERSSVPLDKDTFTVMFNPTSLSVRHENVLTKYQGLNTSGREAKYSHTKSEEVSFQIILDGTGVTNYPLPTFTSKTVSEQINQFLNMCFDMQGSIHEPKFLKIQWGEGVLQDFDCRLQSVDIKYTSFDRKGAPLRATLDAVFVEDLAPGKRVRQEGKNSPDLSHSRVVKSGDTLPLLCREIYGSAHHYVRVAQFNNLTNFRNLLPGQTLVFPPLAETER
jgi:hypothetical protein